MHALLLRVGMAVRAMLPDRCLTERYSWIAELRRFVQRVHQDVYVRPEEGSWSPSLCLCHGLILVSFAKILLYRRALQLLLLYYPRRLHFFLLDLRLKVMLHFFRRLFIFASIVRQLPTLLF